MNWTLARLTSALGHLTDAPHALPSGQASLGAISTDTRRIAPGDVFVALRGERYDAHDFLAEAVSRGAAVLVVSDGTRAWGLGRPCYVVSDTTVALGALGAWWRRTWGGTVVAVAGSNGKTTSRELIRAGLAGTLDVHASRGNLNNQVGVPLSLLEIPDHAQAAVIEIGTNQPGEVDLLRRIVGPDIAVVTSIGEEHLEGLGSLEGVLQEEASVFHDAAIAVTPAAQPEVAEAARPLARQVIDAGLDAGSVRPDAWGLTPDGRGWATFGQARLELRLRGLHNLRNAMLAVACARACGVPDESSFAGIGAVEPLDMRGQWVDAGGLTIINDAYNANPASMREALALVDVLRGDRPVVAVLGSMRELGPQAPALHDEIARRAVASSAAIVAGIGDFEAPLAAHRGDRVVTAPDVDELWTVLAPRLPANAVVLLKASRGVRLERMVPLLTTWSQPGRSTLNP